MFNTYTQSPAYATTIIKEDVEELIKKTRKVLAQSNPENHQVISAKASVECLEYKLKYPSNDTTLKTIYNELFTLYNKWEGLPNYRKIPAPVAIKASVTQQKGASTTTTPFLNPQPHTHPSKQMATEPPPEAIFAQQISQFINTGIKLAYKANKEIENYQFFHSGLDRIAAEIKLKGASEGAFLFRSSSSPNPNIIALSFNQLERGTILPKHTLLTLDLQTGGVVGKEQSGRSYKSLQEFLLAYKEILRTPLAAHQPQTFSLTQQEEPYKNAGNSRIRCT